MLGLPVVERADGIAVGAFRFLLLVVGCCELGEIKLSLVSRDDFVCPGNGIRATYPGRLGLGPELQVLRPVVVTYAVDVMNVLVGQQMAAE